MDSIEEKICDILNKVLSLSNLGEHLKVDDDISELGLNSINYIKVIIEIENYYDIEFEDSKLNNLEMHSISEIANYVRTLINGGK